MVCSPTVWSAVSSALANATLAGVLAGFMLNGIVMLLGGKSVRSPGYVQAACLLFAAFVALGLDAYLFGLVTGDTSMIACRREWTAAMFAAGLLGVGAIAVIVGFVFLFGVYFSETKSDEKNDRQGELDDATHMLQTMCDTLRVGVAVAIIALLFLTAQSYVSSIFVKHVPTWASDLTIGGLIADGLVFLYVWLGILVLRPESKFSNSLHPNGAGALDAVRRATYATVGYSLMSVIAVTFVVLQPVPFWNHSHVLLNVMIAGTIVWVQVISMAPLGLLLAPAFGPKTSTAGPASADDRLTAQGDEHAIPHPGPWC